jgi:hypothetical protein
MLQMAQVRRATIAAEVSKELNDWIIAAHEYMPENEFLFKKIERDAEKLSSVDGFAGSMLRSVLWHATGNLEESLRWIKNAKRWPHSESETLQVETLIYSNLGHFSSAAEALVLYDPAPTDDLLFSLSLVTCKFDFLRKKVDVASVAHNEEWLAARKTSEDCLMALQNIGASEQHLREVLEIAGDVLRSRRFFFAGDKPLIRAIHDGILYQLRVRTDAETADAMTDEVLTRMVEENLDAPGLSFSFIAA